MSELSVQKVTGVTDLSSSGPVSITQLNVVANTTNGAIRITQDGVGSAIIVENSANSLAPHFVVSNTGNVGFGTASPTSKIDIQGTIKATAFVGSGAGLTGVTASSFATGTVMIFAQTSAPTGWTKSTTHNDKALRVVSGTAGSGGTVAFTTAFASKSVAGTVGSTTLTTTQIPAHTHSYNFPTSATATSGTDTTISGTGTTSSTSGSQGGGGSHTHSFTGTAIDMSVQYVDVIIATKD